MLCVCSSLVFLCCAVLTFSTRGIASCQLWATRAFRLSLTAGVTMVISQCDWHVSFVLFLQEIKQDFACPAPPSSPIFLVLNVHHCKEGILGVSWHSGETVGVSQAQKFENPCITQSSRWYLTKSTWSMPQKSASLTTDRCLQ